MKNLATLIRNGDARFARVWSIVSASLLLATAGWSQRLIWLGTLGGNWSEARDVSADGSVVVGVARNAAGQDRAFRWTQQTGMQDLGTLGGYSAAYGVSADGSVVVGGSGGRAFRWVLTNSATGAGTMYDLGAQLGNNWLYSASDVSADGRVVVGTAYNPNNTNFRRAFRWVLTNPATGAGTMYDLGTQLRYSSTEAVGVSADGRIVVGTINNNGNIYAFYWVLVNPATGWGTATTISYGGQVYAYAVSADGFVMVGDVYPKAFRWTVETGRQDLADIVCNHYPSVRGVSADGSVVVGYVYNPTGGGYARAVRWKRAGGDDLNITYNELLTDGSRLMVAYAVSPNGRYIVGRGYNAATGREEAFLLDTGVSRCLDSDVNGDGVVDDADLLQVLFDFGRGCN